MSEPYILVVDDVALMGELACEFLSSAGFRVRTLTDPELVMLNIADERPDVVVLDVDMPVLSGLDVLRQLRSAPDYADLPVLMMTAHGQTHRIVASFGEGASDYLFKPYVGHDLIDRVRRLLPRRAAAA